MMPNTQSTMNPSAKAQALPLEQKVELVDQMMEQAQESRTVHLMGRISLNQMEEEIKRLRQEVEDLSQEEDSAEDSSTRPDDDVVKKAIGEVREAPDEASDE